MIWPSIDGSVEWVQNEKSEGPSGFAIHKVNGRQCKSGGLLPLDFLLETKQHPDTECSYRQSRFPKDFSYCPHCGMSLIEDNAVHDKGNWLPPYGSGDGLKLYRKQVLINTEQFGQEFKLPHHAGMYAFCTAKLGCRKKILVAIQRNNGVLWFYNTEHDKWTKLQGTVGKSDAIPSWSWSVSTDTSESGLCIPNDEAPVWVRIDWLTNTVSVIKGEGRSLGGAAVLGDIMLVPVLQSGGSLVLAAFKEGEGSWSYVTALYDDIDIKAYLENESGKEAFTGIPVKVDGESIVYWPCRGGYIQASISVSGGVEWSFSPWETDEYPAIALVELGPPHQEGGSSTALWELCKDYDPKRRDTTVYKVFKLGGQADGYEGEDWESIDQGQMLSTGKACFSTTWDFWKKRGETDLNASEHKDLRIPLLEFEHNGLVLLCNVASWRGRDSLDTFTDFFKKKNTKTHIRFVLDGSGKAECSLKAEGVSGRNEMNDSLFLYDVSKVPEISVFIYESSLHIYLPEIRKSYRWNLLTEEE